MPVLRWHRLAPRRSERQGALEPPRRSRSRRLGALEQLEPRLVLSTVPVVSMTYNVVTDTPATTNAFVVDLYGDVLFRDPDSQGLALWSDRLNTRQVTAGGAFAAFVTSPEFSANEAPVLSMYEAYLGRPAAAPELRFWIQQERHGRSLGWIATQIARSPEFIATNGNVLAMSDSDFLNFLYENDFLRAPSPSELTFWSQALRRGGVTRGDLLAAFVQAPEFAVKQPSVSIQNIVNMAYIGLWDRSPDSSFASEVAGFTDAAALGDQFINDQHYLGIGAVRNYVVGLYEGLLDREPNVRGYRHWREQMLSLTLTDAEVYAAFVRSLEFRVRNGGRHLLPNTVTSTYEAFLGRAPTPAELRGGVSYLHAGHSLQGLATQFLTSEEFTENGYAQNIHHTVVIFQENWSFDSLLGLFPGVNGIANASPVSQRQVKRDGKPYRTLPRSEDVDADLPSRPFNLARFRSPFERAGDPVHLFYQEQAQINGGLMNQFVAWSYGYPGSKELQGNNLELSYYDSRTLPLGSLAAQYTIDDNTFHSGFGGSWFNAIWLIAAAAPFYSGPIPPEYVAQLDSEGKLKLDPDGAVVNSGIVTPDGYAVNDIDSVGFHDPELPGPFLPVLNDSDPSAPHYMPTIGDRLSDANVSWKWYAEGWDQAVRDIHVKAVPGFVYHHQPFSYYANYQLGTPAQQEHLQDLQRYEQDLSQGTLPSVVYLKGTEKGHDEHPGAGPEFEGQLWASEQVAALQDSSSWSNSTVIITYDENGGRWDHVAPPVIDRWGPGSRVPTVVISPFAKRGFVDHTPYETVSIDKTLEVAFDLPALSSRDDAANPMFNSYSFSPTDIVKNN
jgi:acid phosphatase